MEQTKVESFIETMMNIGTGFLLAYSIWRWGLTPAIEHGYVTIKDSFIITTIFTITSVIRSYYWRRFFARKFHKVIHRQLSKCWQTTGW